MKKNIVIIILSIVILGLGGYLVYDKVINKDLKNNIEEKNNLGEEYTILAKTYINNILELDVYNIFERLSKSGLSDEIKISMAIANSKDVRNYNCLDAFEINTNYGEYRPVKNNMWGCGQNEPVDAFNYDLVNNEYKKLFGSIENAKKISVLETWVYDYSSKIDSYVKLSPRFGPVVNNLYYYDIENIDLINEDLIIEISYLPYSLKLGSDDVFQYILNDVNYTDKTEEEIKQAYYDNKNLLPRLTFNYKKENGKYILSLVKSQFEK